MSVSDEGKNVRGVVEALRSGSGERFQGPDSARCTGGAWGWFASGWITQLILDNGGDMRRGTGQGPRVRLAVAVVLGGLLLAMGGSEAGAAGLTFRVVLGGGQLSNASAYDAFDDSEKPTLRVTLKAVAAGSLVNLEVGQQFGSAQVEIIDVSAFTVVATYTLSDVKITAVRISGEGTSSVLTEEIVMSGKTLAVTTP